jgi:SAM-dependent methyltransferase
VSGTFLRWRIYPELVERFGNPPPIEMIRRRLIPQARGTVLEVGAGSGANFPYYDVSKVKQLYALEPNQGMVRLASAKLAGSPLNVQFIGLPVESLPLQDGSVDTVVTTFTLCTIAGVEETIRGLQRVLRPEGRLIFFEIGLAPDAVVRRWQALLEPVCTWLFQGLRLRRDIPALLRGGGFEIQEMESGYVAPAPKALTHCWWGTARQTRREH